MNIKLSVTPAELLQILLGLRIQLVHLEKYETVNNPDPKAQELRKLIAKLEEA